MTQESEKGHRSWWWALPAAAGVALVMTSVMLWPSASSNPGVPVVQAQANTPTPTATATRTPTPEPTTNPQCDLSVSKSDSPTTVGEGGQITYTITISNEGDENGDCTDLTVTDTIPADTDCVSATDDGSLDFEIDGCDASGDVVWATDDNLDDGVDVVLTMVVELTSGAQEDDTINNKACAVSSDDVVGDCDTETTKVGAPVTATPTPAPTATTRPPTTVQPPVAFPTLSPPPPLPLIAPAVVPPATGTGTASGGTSATQTLALVLGLAGVSLLLVTGVTFARRAR
jgi:uncharacterized repeat protein (TIGR01451 family)